MLKNCFDVENSTFCATNIQQFVAHLWFLVTNLYIFKAKFFITKLNFKNAKFLGHFLLLILALRLYEIDPQVLS